MYSYDDLKRWFLMLCGFVWQGCKWWWKQMVWCCSVVWGWIKNGCSALWKWIKDLCHK